MLFLTKWFEYEGGDTVVMECLILSPLHALFYEFFLSCFHDCPGLVRNLNRLLIYFYASRVFFVFFLDRGTNTVYCREFFKC